MPGRQVREPNRARRLVDVLAAGAAGAERVLAHVVRVDLDLDRVGDLRRHVDRREAGLPLAFGVERADPHQPVHARLALEIAVGHRPADGDRRVADAGLLVVLPLEQLDRVAVLLRPLRVHPQQHLGPVVGVGAAVAGVDRSGSPRPRRAGR